MVVLTTVNHLCSTLMQDDKRGDSPRKTFRLPAIAPKDDHSSSASSSRSGRVSGPAVPPRARLPPRSRTGCWTCRTRKVKCDEGRPLCGQCSRLGHVCDYSPRLSFRDDTPRVVERMADVTVAGSSVWDSVASPAPSSAGSTIADDLPPFASLMTDEEREHKAAASSPGTYQVLVNPDSFQHLPEYSDDAEVKRERLSPLRRGSIAASFASSLGRESASEGVPVPGDPNTVVLARFEDSSRKPRGELKSPVSPTVQNQTFIKLEELDIKPVRSEEEIATLEHFRNVVWRQLVPAELESNSSVVLIDRVAAEFPPLQLAMMAVASLSLAPKDGGDNVDALQHYTQAYPELQNHLKTEEDLTSDGVFLTHFLMLIYETATANNEHSLIRTDHIRMLLRTALSRRKTLGGERFPFIIWWICNIDLDALFSGAGSGEFIVSMLEQESVPPPSFHLYPLGPDGSSLVYADERETLPALLQLDYEITNMAFSLARLAHEFRHDGAFHTLDARQRDLQVRLRQSRIYEIQDQLRQTWLTPSVLSILQSRELPLRSQRIYEHAFTLYRACIIYSHTSMWSSQRLETPPDFHDEIAIAAGEIIQLAHSVISGGNLECRYLVFPLFMAGFASNDGNQKQMALELIQQMERECVGRNTRATARVLNIVYKDQYEYFLNTSSDLSVDWVDVMTEQGLTVVSFGL